MPSGQNNKLTDNNDDTFTSVVDDDNEVGGGAQQLLSSNDENDEQEEDRSPLRMRTNKLPAANNNIIITSEQNSDAEDVNRIPSDELLFGGAEEEPEEIPPLGGDADADANIDDPAAEGIKPPVHNESQQTDEDEDEDEGHLQRRSQNEINNDAAYNNADEEHHQILYPTGEAAEGGSAPDDDDRHGAYAIQGIGPQHPNTTSTQVIVGAAEQEAQDDAAGQIITEGDGILLQATLVDEDAQEEAIENMVREEVSRREREAARNTVQASIVVEEEKCLSGNNKKIIVVAAAVAILLALVLVVALVSGLLLMRDTGIRDEGGPQIGPPTDNNITNNEDDGGPTEMRTEPPLTWKLIGELTSTELAGDRYGASVDINEDGSVVAIGAPYPPFYPNITGYVEVYENDGEGGKWRLRGGRIDAPEETKRAERGAEFGRSLSLSDDGNAVLIFSTTLIGLYRFDSRGNWFLNRTFDVPNITIAPGPTRNNLRKARLSGSGEYVAISSEIDNVNHLQVFAVADSSDGNRETDFAFTEPDPYSNFGNTLDISREGDTIAIGGGDFAIVYFYDKDDKADRVSLSSRGDVLAIGSPHGVTNTGKITTHRYVMESANWTTLGSTIRGGPAENWGKRSMSLSGDGTSIAVTSLDASDFSAGSLRLLKYSEDIGEWEQFDSSIGHEDPDFSPFKCALSHNGNTVVCSDMWASHPGFARVYRLGHW